MYGADAFMRGPLNEMRGCSSCVRSYVRAGINAPLYFLGYLLTKQYLWSALTRIPLVWASKHTIARYG